MKGIGASLLAIALSSTAAMAADITAPYLAPIKAPVAIEPAFSWTGFYVGAGGGWGRATADESSYLDQKGGFAGGFVGGNYQMGSFVIGLEGEAYWADISQSASAFGITVKSTENWFGTVTARGGFAVDRILVYAKGGYGFAGDTFTVSGGGAPISISATFSGPTVGGGLEFAFTRNWTGRVEYMHAWYGSQTFYNGLLSTGNIQADSVKTGVAYLIH